LINLVSDIPSQLISNLKIDDFKKDLEIQLLIGFNERYLNIQVLNIEIINNKNLYIIYGEGINIITDITILSNILLSLNLNELKTFSLINKKFEKIYKNDIFWIYMYNKKFNEFKNKEDIEELYKRRLIEIGDDSLNKKSIYENFIDYYYHNNYEELIKMLDNENIQDNLPDILTFLMHDI